MLDQAGLALTALVVDFHTDQAVVYQLALVVDFHTDQAVVYLMAQINGEEFLHQDTKIS
jgi:hypothetical protein